MVVGDVTEKATESEPESVQIIDAVVVGTEIKATAAKLCESADVLVHVKLLDVNVSEEQEGVRVTDPLDGRNGAVTLTEPDDSPACSVENVGGVKTPADIMNQYYANTTKSTLGSAGD